MSSRPLMQDDQVKLTNQVKLISHFKIALSVLLVVSLSNSASATQVQISDFRIGSKDVAADTAYDPGDSTSFTTRTVIGAPIHVNSTFSVGSQNADGTLDAATDVGLRTFSSLTRIRNLSRYEPSGIKGKGVQRIGMAQWSFDLSAIESHLAANPTETLKKLDLDLVTSHSDKTKKVDVYLSFTLPEKDIVLTGIDTSDSGSGAGATNWTNFYQPAVGAKVGDIVNETHQVLVSGSKGDLALNHSLLTLYNAGVREVNLSIAGADFWSGRNIDILEESGISFMAAESSSQ